MTTVAAPPEQRIVLHEVSWDTYERLLAERGETSTPRFTYDRGVLEIMSPGMAHERLDYLIGILVATLAEAWNIDVTGLGHLTYRNPAWEGGFEPDGCFYVGRAAAIRERSEIDARVDPPPDVVVEVDITSTSIAKLALLARFGVPEVWRHDGERATILVLGPAGYREEAASRALPGLTAEAMTTLLAAGQHVPLGQWLAKVRGWAAAAR